MIKIMVIDDESIFRDFLRTTIDWAAYGFEIVCEARNGVEALELAERHLPDIALVDINMPFMNGLELAQKLKEKDPDIGVVLLTGHSEFEYARKAVRIGVDDYITKPFTKEELILSLLKLQDHILKVQGAKSHEKNAQQLLREQLLTKILSGQFVGMADALREQVKLAGIRTYSSRYKVAVIEIDNMDQNWNEWSERLLWRFAVSNVVGDIVAVEGNHWSVADSKGRIVSIVEFADQEDEREFGSNAYEHICEMVKKYLKFTVTVGIGSAYEGLEGIHSSYREALHSLQNKFVFGGDRVFDFEKFREANPSIGFYPSEIQEELLAGLRSHDPDKVQSLLNQVLGYIRERRLSLDYAYAIYMGLISLALSYVTEAGYHIGDLFGDDFSPFSEIRRQETLEGADLWMRQLFERTVRLTTATRLTRSRKIAEAAKEYIEAHFPEPDLGVETIAQHLYINSSYLRSVFKKEVGMTVIDYLLLVRMNKAKELIRAGQIKLADIAEMIGYSDAGYFSKSFKKHYGLSPSEYENSIV